MTAWRDPWDRLLDDTFVDESGCWIWKRWKNAFGYGYTSVRRVTRLAHRLSYEVFVGPIPEGMTLDHLCKKTSCCNPAHLEPVSMALNLRRRSPDPDRCPAGHEYAGKNLWQKGNHRLCKACARERNRRYYSERKHA